MNMSNEQLKVNISRKARSDILDAQDDLRHVRNLLMLVDMACNGLRSKEGEAICEAVDVAMGSLSVADGRLTSARGVLA